LFANQNFTRSTLVAQPAAIRDASGVPTLSLQRLIAHRHINMNGVMRFNIERAADLVESGRRKQKVAG